VVFFLSPEVLSHCGTCILAEARNKFDLGNLPVQSGNYFGWCTLIKPLVLPTFPVLRSGRMFSSPNFLCDVFSHLLCLPPNPHAHSLPCFPACVTWEGVFCYFLGEWLGSLSSLVTLGDLHSSGLAPNFTYEIYTEAGASSGRALFRMIQVLPTMGGTR
jgi:hypothetical protein